MNKQFWKSLPPAWLIIGFSLLVHLPGITSPMLDYQAYRQCQTASMARNYVRHGMHFLNPELDTAGTPERAGTEFPIYSYLLAIVFKFFGTREVWGRLLSALFGAWGAVFLFRIVQRRLGDDRALASALVMCVLPIHVYFTRTVQPEPMALWGFLGFVDYWDQWLREGNVRDAVVAVILGALAPLLKLPFFYVLLPVGAYLSWEKYGWSFLRRIDGLTAVGAIFAMTWLWYHYAKTAPVVILPLTVSEHLENLRPIFTVKLWMNHFVSRVPELCLTYPGILFAAVGAYHLKKERSLRFWALWFFATAAYIILLGDYGRIHRYTELPFAPITAVFIGTGILVLWGVTRDQAGRIAVGILVVGMPLHTGLRIAHWYRWEYPWVFQARDAVARSSGPDDLVITNTREHPVLLYYVDRYGYAPALEETGLDELADYRAKGARLFLTPTGVDESWSRHPEWKTQIEKSARLVTETPDYSLYRFD